MNINLWDADTSQTQADCAAVDRTGDHRRPSGELADADTADVECGPVWRGGSRVRGHGAATARLVARVTVAATQPSDQTAKVGVSGLPASVMVKAGDVGAWVTQ